MAGLLRGGGGVKCQALKEKFFLNPFFQRSKGHLAREGGGLGTNGPAIKRRTFFAASLSGFEINEMSLSKTWRSAN